MDQDKSVRLILLGVNYLTHIICRRNFGLGRNVPFHPDDRKVRVHMSVEKRMKDTKDKKNPYKPQARNWDSLMDLDMIKWVA
jgi:hypothetical protein